MDSTSPVTSSPSSDQRLWGALRSRVDALLEHRKQLAGSPSAASCGVESRCGKRLREDSLLLIRGLDSVASSLSQLKDTLDEAQQGVQSLANHSITDLSRRESQIVEEDKEAEPKTKRPCFPEEPKEDNGTGKEGSPTNTNDGDLKIDEEGATAAAKCGGTLKKAKNVGLRFPDHLAISMATKASSLARELKTIKSDLGFMQERSALLEEENRRLRDGLEKGLRPDEDDLVRLQLEALLAEKSRLANDNATLTRENNRLLQLVEYHQLTWHDFSESYEQVVHGICLDFSSAEKTSSEFGYDDDFTGAEAPCTPRANLGSCSSNDCGEQQE
ncbi:hypothetical protein Taro_022979 [Colocasia esculenta]|uniref:Uncharacterized protein n=1 Tax=Colocasia esculenta TaxID=4460 RepID=A0A843V3D0_COLES|nr:hypothetical protein [Colocasia esculenta]